MDLEGMYLARIADLEEQYQYLMRENMKLRELIRQLMEEKEDEE